MNGTNGKQSDFPDVALVPYPVIVAATKGDPDAMKIVLQHFSGYICLLYTSIMKDLTRWGRDYLQVGNAMEIFRRNNVRFIAVNNGIDSEKPDTDVYKRQHLPFFFSFLIYIKGSGYRSPLLFIFLFLIIKRPPEIPKTVFKQRIRDFGRLFAE